jgi:hypothetical protein
MALRGIALHRLGGERHCRQVCTHHLDCEHRLCGRFRFEFGEHRRGLLQMHVDLIGRHRPYLTAVDLKPDDLRQKRERDFGCFASSARVRLVLDRDIRRIPKRELRPEAAKEIKRGLSLENDL